MPRLLVSAVQ